MEGRLTREPNFTPVGESRRSHGPEGQLAQSARLTEAPQFAEVPEYRSPIRTPPRPGSTEDLLAQQRAEAQARAQQARAHYDTLANDEKFAELDYDSQTEVRQRLVERFLPAQEGYAELDPGVQEHVYKRLVFTTPAFRDARMQEAAAAITERIRKNPEDPEVAEFVTESHLSNTLLQGNVMRWLRQDPNSDTLDWMSEDHNYVDDALTGSESDKLRQHISTLGGVYNSEIIRERERNANVRGTIENLGLFAGFVAASAKVMGPMYAAHKALGGTLGSAISPTAGKFLAWNLPKITTSAAGSVAWVAASEARAQLAPRGERLLEGDAPEMWDNVREAFGEDFKVGLMMTYAFGAAGIALQGVRGLSHLWQGRKAMQLSGDEIKALKAGLKSPALELDEAALSLMPRESQHAIRAKQWNEQIMQNREMMKQIRNHPEELARLVAPNADTWIMDTTVEGRKAWELLYEVTPTKEGVPQFQYETVTDLLTLKKRVGERTVQKYQAVRAASGDKVAQRYAETNRVAFRWGRAANAIDNTLDARFTINENLDELRKASGDFVSPVDRSVINPSELDELRHAISDLQNTVGPGGTPKIHQLQVTEEVLTSARTQGSIMLREGVTDGNAVAIAAREAAPEQTESILKMAAKMSERSGVDEALARKLTALDTGFDSLRYADGSVEYLWPEKIKMLSAAVDPKTGRVGGVAATRAVPAQLEDAYLTTQHVARAGIQANIPLNAATADADLMATAMTSLRGNISSESVETVRSVGKGFLEQRGAKATGVTVKLSRFANRVDEAGTAAKVTQTSEGVEILIPKSISRQDAQQKMIREIFDGLEAATGKKVAKKAATFGQQVEKAYQSQSGRFVAPFTDARANKKWVTSIIENHADGTMTMNPDGTVRVKLPGVRAANFSSIDEAYNRVMDRLWTPEHLRMDLARKGIKLTKTKAGGLRASSSAWSEPVEGKNVVDLMDRLNYRPERLDAAYAPSVVKVDSQSVNVSFDGFSYRTSSTQDALQVLGRFEDSSYLARQTNLRSLKNAEISRNMIGEIDVTLPDTASRLTFANQDEALAWVRNEMDTVDGFRRLAHNKGIDLTYSSGAWNVSDGRNFHKAHDIPGLKRILKNYPDPQAAPNVFAEFDPQLARQLDALSNSGQIKVSARTLPSAGSGTFYEFEALAPNKPVEVGYLKRIANSVQRQIETFDYIMESQVRPQHPQLFKFYRSIEHGRRLSIKASNDLVNKHLAPAMYGADGKLMSNKQMEKVTMFIEASTNDQLEAFVRNHGALTADEQGLVNAMRTTFGSISKDGVTTGLAHRFGITPEEFIGKYMPRIRNYLQQAPGHEVNRFVTADELLDRVFQGNQKTISQIRPFFEHMRAADAAEMARDMNAARLLMKYTSLGHKKMFMNDAWRGVSSYMRANRGSIDPQMALRINLYRDQIIGVHRPAGYEAVADVGENLWRAFGSSDPLGGRQLFDKAMSLNYLTNMAFRPYLAIRNSFQPFTTLAPRFGNRVVLKSYNEVGKLGEDYYRFLEGIGLITEAPPIVNQTHDMNSLMGRVLKKGLALYKRSDDITRAVAFRTGENLIDEGLEAFAQGRITTRAELRKAIGLNKINPTTADEIMFHLDQLTPEGTRRAKNLFGTLLSEDTMFAYRPEQMPAIHSGHIIGKMFGQYGTYSAGYRANIYRGLQYGSAAERAAFVTRFVANQTALFGAVSAVGINAYNFVPGAPALFSGGPNFNAGVLALQSLNTGFSGAEARRELARQYSPVTGSGLNVPRQLPVARHLQWAIDAYEYSDEGDYWKSFLSLTMTPVRRE